MAPKPRTPSGLLETGTAGPPWRDPLFAAALAAGPLAWAVLWGVHAPAGGPAWVLAHPGTFLLLALLYPAAEEIAFRGLVQGWLLQRLPAVRWGPVSGANLATSLLFSGLHLLTHSPLWAGAVFLPSLVFGFFRERHHGLPAPVILHGFYNSGYFALFPPA